jgi:DNA-3-methyladenine glycosylase I
MNTIQTPGLMLADDGSIVCAWRAAMPDYHDHEWGRPVTDDIRLFEKICLEGFQAGLAWITILRKRAQFRIAFDDFDFHRIARYDDADVARLLVDPGIVRNRAKIVSVINNARRACELVEQTGSLADWLWQFEPAPGTRPPHITLDYLQATTSSAASVALSRALKQRGWSFVGPTTMYAFMQAMGLVNDHLSGCCCRAPVEAERDRRHAAGA